MVNKIELLNKKILVVDNDGMFRGIYAGRFKEDGFDVKTANDGEEAWDLIVGGYTPDLVFTGIVMPRLGGFDLIRKIQLDPKLTLIPVVVFSHRGLPEDWETAIWLGVDDFIIQGNIPLIKVSRRIKLILGLNAKYEIPLKRNEGDDEALINLLNKQRSERLSVGRNQDIFLEIEPQKEGGIFKISINEKKQSKS